MTTDEEGVTSEWTTSHGEFHFHDYAFDEYNTEIITLEADYVEVDDRGRITIPVALRDRLGILPGDELAVELDDGELVVRPEQSGLLTVTSGKTDWGAEAFPDSGEATFGGRPRDDE